MHAGLNAAKPPAPLPCVCPPVTACSTCATPASCNAAHLPRSLLLPVPLCGPGDPRHLRTARGMMAYHLALGAGHSGLAELLHPDIPYTFIFSNDDLQVCVCVCVCV